jgi:CHAD domain-containing protein
MTLNLLQIITLDAFIEALHNVSTPLPAELQTQINQVGDRFAENPTEASDRLLELAEHESLKPLYLQARIRLQKEYETQERNRFYSPENQNQPGVKPEDAPSNIAIKVKVLKAPDPVSAAQNLSS